MGREKATELFRYLRALGLADQVHLRNDNQVVFYHWNQIASELVPSVTLQGSKIERIYYPRSLVPKVFNWAQNDFEIDLGGEHGYVRNYRD